ncbi:EamA family transporter [Pseudoduganella aquatica]|uniref:EamA family transporter n=1 Tax=Pseudoduganella aquatica TaxID=2660641 RepID=UPI001E5F5039|nr:EamA family transporter [Pseudoduganella aquatica]
MSGQVAAVILLAALLHAGWNALIKAGKDAFLTSVLAVSGAALISLAALPLLPAPAPGSWPMLCATTAIHYCYFGLMSAAYRHGDMSLAYPLMRGSAPLLVALASAPLLGEQLTAVQYAAVACISGGIFSMALARGGAVPAAAAATEPVPRQRRAVLYALLNACAIACYTLVDGVGARRSGSPLAYTMWLFVLTAAGLLAWTLPRRRAGFAAYAAAHWRAAALGGAGTLASYALSLWAMTVAPVAAVAALREISILFAAAIAVVFLHEKIIPQRYAAIALIACGAALMRYA